VNELVLVYRRHTYQYYRKNGKLTREATIIDDVIRFLRKHHATTFLDDFGPVSLDELRDGMITDLDWSRKHINKQVNRLIWVSDRRKFMRSRKRVQWGKLKHSSHGTRMQ